MTGDEKKVNKFLKLLPDVVIRDFFYTLSYKTINHNSSYVLDKYKDYVIEHDLEFNDAKLNKKYKLFSEAIIKLQQFTVYNFYYDGIHKNVYVFYQEDFKREYPELYISKEKELEELIYSSENAYILLRKSMEEYILSGDTPESKDKKDINNKYSEANEDILLKTLGLKIKGNYLIRGKIKKEINSTDKALIYFLFYKSIKNEDECFTADDLSSEKSINKTNRYIKNRISIINKSIKEIITKELYTKIPKFIKTEPKKRGYHLNPKIIHIKPKIIKK